MWALPLLVISPLAVSFSQTDSEPSPWVREVFIRGNETTKREVILREMTLVPGKRFVEDEVEPDRERIYNLQLFNRVDIDTHTIGDSTDVYVTVDERWYFYPFPVVGIVNRDWSKLVYGLGVAHANLVGLNQKLFAEAVTGYDRWVQLDYRNPRFLGSSDHYFGVQLSYSNLHPEALDGSEYHLERWIGKFSLGVRYGLHTSLVATAGMESWKAPSIATIRRTASGDGHDVFSTVSVQFVDDRRYLREYPLSGSYVQLDISKDGLGESEMDIVRFHADVREYIPVWSDMSVALRGYTQVTGGGIVPSYRHIFYGYRERIRGEFSTVREGEAQLGGNVELRFTLLEPRYYTADFIPVAQFRTLRYGLYGALFADAGKLWYRNQSVAEVPLRSGYGFGLHAVLPYGAILRTEIGISPRGNAEFIFDAGASF